MSLALMVAAAAVSSLRSAWLYKQRQFLVHELKVVYEKAANRAADRVRYTYKEGSKEVTFSENSPSAE